MRNRDAGRVAGGEDLDPARTVIGPHFMKVEPGERILAARNRTSTFGEESQSAFEPAIRREPGEGSQIIKFTHLEGDTTQCKPFRAVPTTNAKIR
jgi:hypothetical protein